jgi:hypothetical protein
VVADYRFSRTGIGKMCLYTLSICASPDSFRRNIDRLSEMRGSFCQSGIEDFCMTRVERRGDGEEQHSSFEF